MIEFLFKAALLLSGLFLILLVLVQRGRGGGLAGALGGAGGQSAFGTKAGDVFTKITIGVAAFWILLCAAAVKTYRADPNSSMFSNLPGVNVAPAQPATGTGAAMTSTGGTTTATGGTTTTTTGTSSGGGTPATSGTSTTGTTTTTTGGSTPPATTPPATSTTGSGS